MLKKLLKYDLKWIFKLLIVFYSIAIVFSILTRILFSIDNSTVFNILGQICSGVTISFIFSILINNIMRCWARFIKNLYGDESYLTHTLPVNKKTIFISKFLTGIITMFASVLVILIVLFIAYYSKENLEWVKTSLNILATIYNSTIIKLLLIIFLVFFLEMVFTIFAGYIGILLGHRSNDKRIVKSIIYGFITYMATQTITLIIMFICGLFNKDIMNLFMTNNIVNIDILKIIMYGAILLYTVYIVSYYVIGLKIFKKGIDVD
ncbi:MAG: hypothetical protein IKL65_04360 [Bacilli bacterium]|nr:hypothetical protein [Bacilli bacterium]